MKSALPDHLTDPYDDLLASHQKRIYFFIRSMVYQPDDAQDVLQDVNAILIRKRHQFELGTNFGAWALSIARFECLSYLAKRRGSAWESLDHGLIERLADRAEERSSDADLWFTSLEKCRAELPEEWASLLVLRYERKIGLEAVASQWKTSVGALKQKLLRIRARLKDCILRRCGNENFPDLGF